MAFATKFEYDIFISYAHKNNRRSYQKKKGWVDILNEELQYALNDITSANTVSIWRDPMLEDFQRFNKVIESRINDSAIFLALNSNHYMGSSYCQKELKQFYKKAEQEEHGIYFGENKESTRIIHVLLQKQEFENWNDEFKGVRGIDFYDQEKELFPVDPDSKEFRDKVKELAMVVYKLLSEFKKVYQSPREQDLRDVVKRPKGLQIFLSDVTDGLRQAQVRLNQALNDQGHEVIWDIPPPYPYNEHEEEVRKKISKCNLSIHLLNDNPGRKIQGDDNFYTQKQLEMVLDTNLPQIVWAPEDLVASQLPNESYRTMFSGLEKFRLKNDIQYIKGLEADLNNDILPQVGTLLEQLKLATTDRRLKILIEAHRKDEDEIDELIAISTQNKILPIVLPEEDNPIELQHALKHLLKQVVAVVFYQHNVSTTWVETRLKHVLKTIQILSLPLKSCAIYSALEKGLSSEEKVSTTHQFSFKQIPIVPLRDPENFNEYLQYIKTLR